MRIISHNETLISEITLFKLLEDRILQLKAGHLDVEDNDESYCKSEDYPLIQMEFFKCLL